MPEPEPGAYFYARFCATCHMADGGGVAGMQPSLKKSRVVSGEPATQIALLLRDPAAALPASRESCANTMPPFAQRSDSEIASLPTYVRRPFGPASSSALTPEQVAGLRAQA